MSHVALQGVYGDGLLLRDLTLLGKAPKPSVIAAAHMSTCMSVYTFVPFSYTRRADVRVCVRVSTRVHRRLYKPVQVSIHMHTHADAHAYVRAHAYGYAPAYTDVYAQPKPPDHCGTCMHACVAQRRQYLFKNPSEPPVIAARACILACPRGRI